MCLRVYKQKMIQLYLIPETSSFLQVCGEKWCSAKCLQSFYSLTHNQILYIGAGSIKYKVK